MMSKIKWLQSVLLFILSINITTMNAQYNTDANKASEREPDTDKDCRNACLPKCIEVNRYGEP